MPSAAALRVLTEAGVADLLKDANPLVGVQVDVLARKTKINRRKLCKLENASPALVVN